MSYYSYWCCDCEILEMTEAQAREHIRLKHASGRWATAQRLRRMRWTVMGSFSGGAA